ncbi:MAG: hypothetical protein HY814_06360 [Candidatus Riflebacteria bacterium]|nr:hypothetical protein [Candidatus Riflebacteria bacterium]
MTLDELVLAARLLSDAERRRLREMLDRMEEPPSGAAPCCSAVSEEQRLQAMREFLDLEGALHSDHADVSTEPCRHLADGVWERNHQPGGRCS